MTMRYNLHSFVQYAHSRLRLLLDSVTRRRCANDRYISVSNTKYIYSDINASMCKSDYHDLQLKWPYLNYQILLKNSIEFNFIAISSFINNKNYN